MKESEFIDHNKDKWSSYEKLISGKKTNPDSLRDVFMQVTDDLSYARSNYPNRSVRVYLNHLARQIFDKLGQRKKIKLEPIVKFYTVEVPQLMYLARKEMLISLIVFLLSIGVGIYSSRVDPGFAAQILGEHYVAMTEENIQNKEPMAVYRSGREMESFFAILIINARIDVLILALGVLFGFGALLVLVQNGIMLGVFQYYFFVHGGFQESVVTIWLHGTIEISTIALMGGVGLLAGKGLLLPGSYTRFQSFRKSAGNAAKLLLAILPFTFIAAVIESFITRQTGTPDLIKILFILLSLLCVVFYFVWLPLRIHRTLGSDVIHEKLRNTIPEKEISYKEEKTTGQIISQAFLHFKQHFGRFLGIGFFAGITLAILTYHFFEDSFVSPRWAFAEYIQNLFTDFFGFQDNFWVEPDMMLMAVFSVILFLVLLLNFVLIMSDITQVKAVFNKLKQPHMLLSIGSLMLIAVLFHFTDSSFFITNLVFFGLSFLMITAIANFYQKQIYDDKIKVIKLCLSRPIKHLKLLFALLGIAFFLSLLFTSGLMFIFESFLTDLMPFNRILVKDLLVGIRISVYYGIFFSLIPLIISSFCLYIGSLIEAVEAPQLKQNLSVVKKAAR